MVGTHLFSLDVTLRRYRIALAAIILGAEFYYLPMWFYSQVMLEKCCWTRNSCSDYICNQTVFWGWDRVWSTSEYKCFIIWCSHPRHSSCKNIFIFTLIHFLCLLCCAYLQEQLYKQLFGLCSELLLKNPLKNFLLEDHLYSKSYHSCVSQDTPSEYKICSIIHFTFKDWIKFSTTLGTWFVTTLFNICHLVATRYIIAVGSISFNLCCYI